MMASIDGRIDCAMTEQIGGNEYYEALEMLCIDTTIEGKTTAVNHYAEKELFVPKDTTAVGREEFWVSGFFRLAGAANQEYSITFASWIL